MTENEQKYPKDKGKGNHVAFLTLYVDGSVFVYIFIYRWIFICLHFYIQMDLYLFTFKRGFQVSDSFQHGSYSDHSSDCSSSTDNSGSRRSMPVFSSSSRPPHSPFASMSHARPMSVAIMEPICEATSDGAVVQPNLLNMRLLTETLQEGATWGRGNLEDVLDSLRSVLEDYRGHYPELRKLEQKVEELDRFLNVSRGGG